MTTFDDPSAPDARWPVLIAGGGVVGLSASLFLARQGVPALLVERHSGTSIHPRARGLNGRTMELMRELGLETAIRQAGAAIAPSLGVYSGPSLVQILAKHGQGGWLLRRMRRRGLQAGARWSPRSPTGPCRCTQDLIEPVLLQAARERGVQARFFTELQDVQQDAGGVTAQLLDRQTGARRTVTADYLIAADGARSGIRQRLGAPVSGSGPLSHQLNLYFRADLATLVRGREPSMCLIENPALRGLLASVNNTDRWVLHVSYHPEQAQTPADFPPDRCIDLIRRAIGLPDLAVELLGVLPWESAVRIADRYQHGRVFLAGDAAHVMPPWGGFGANTGIQDAHNLAWKLAAVLDGRADPALLETYDRERQPVARAVGALAGAMNDARGLLAMPRGLAALRRLWHMGKVFPYLTMGYGYASSAVALEPGRPPGPGSNDLRGRPGTRLPHLWLQIHPGSHPGQGERRVSTLDLVGPGLVLLAGARGDRWCQAARRLGLTAHRIGGDLQDVQGKLRSATGVGARGACLIRPDGIVAWRSRGAGEAPDATLARVLARILANPDPAVEPGARGHQTGASPRRAGPIASLSD